MPTAHADSYGPAQYTGGQHTVQGGMMASASDAALSGGGYGGGDSYNNASTVSCTGGITAAFTWTGPDDPPQSVIVTQTCVASWSSGGASAPGGSCSNGLGDTPITNSSQHAAGGVSGKDSSGNVIPHYSVKTGAATLTLPACSASASVTGAMGTGQSVAVSYTAAVSPVTINPVGATQESGGNWNILVGQGCSPVLNGIPGGCTVSSYSWTVTGTTFQSWTVSADHSYTTKVDGPGPLNGPNLNSTPSIPGPHWYWNDLGPGPTSETITCTATVTPPTGQGSAFSLTATQKVKVFTPGFTGTGVAGYMQVNNYAPSSVYELWAGPTSDQKSNGTTGGMNWDLSVMTPSSPAFGTGNFEMVQITTPYDTYSIEGSPTQSDSPGTGLDGEYPYASGVEGNGDINASDSPGIHLITSLGYNVTHATFSPGFTDYLMYQPPGTDSMWVPIGIFVWSTSGDATLPDPPQDSWDKYTIVHGGDAAGTVNAPNVNFVQTNTFPSWTQIVTVSH